MSQAQKPFARGAVRYCYYSVALEPTSLFDGDIIIADSATSGEQFLYDLKAGKYHVETITGPAPSCPWKVTLTFMVGTHLLDK